MADTAAIAARAKPDAAPSPALTREALLRFLDELEAMGESEADVGPDYFAAIAAVRGFVGTPPPTPTSTREETP